jgi:hypothetical protein
MVDVVEDPPHIVSLILTISPARGISHGAYNKTRLAVDCAINTKKYEKNVFVEKATTPLYISCGHSASQLYVSQLTGKTETEQKIKHVRESPAHPQGGR